MLQLAWDAGITAFGTDIAAKSLSFGAIAFNEAFPLYVLMIPLFSALGLVLALRDIEMARDDVPGAIVVVLEDRVPVCPAPSALPTRPRGGR